MRFVECTLEEHGATILAILNDAIVNSTALYDYQPRTMDNMATWFAAKQAGMKGEGVSGQPFPVVGLVDDAGQLLGFASYGAFRNFPAYKYTVEHSVYVHASQRGKGLGKVLLQAVIDRARAQGYHTLVGVIDAANQASIALHKQLGFTESGVMRQAGFKFGRWLDVAFYQLVLETPVKPVDG